MKHQDKLLIDLLLLNPSIQAAWLDTTRNTPVLHLQFDFDHADEPLQLPAWAENLKISRSETGPYKILITHSAEHAPRTTNQLCQDEPIKLGTQIQPQNAAWFGTGGAPVRYLNRNQQPTIGILTNWHVAAMNHDRPGRKIHQPTIHYPPIATLDLFQTPKQNDANYLDAALCDALVDGYHTIDEEILHLGKLADKPTDLSQNDRVAKSGRTTALTAGTVQATGVTARVAYPQGTLLFTDQDLIAHTDQRFSAPGDSGSLVATARTRQPAALLFAGSNSHTLANPVRHILTAWQLTFTLRNR